MIELTTLAGEVINIAKATIDFVEKIEGGYAVYLNNPPHLVKPDPKLDAFLVETPFGDLVDTEEVLGEAGAKELKDLGADVKVFIAPAASGVSHEAGVALRTAKLLDDQLRRVNEQGGEIKSSDMAL